MEKSRTYVCRKLFLYYLLTERGFEPFRVVPDKFNCRHTVWLYTDSPELQAVVTEYYANAPKNN